MKWKHSFLRMIRSLSTEEPTADSKNFMSIAPKSKLIKPDLKSHFPKEGKKAHLDTDIQSSTHHKLDIDTKVCCKIKNWFLLIVYSI